MGYLPASQEPVVRWLGRRAAKAIAMAFPIPVAAPVTRAVLPARDHAGFSDTLSGRARFDSNRMVTFHHAGILQQEGALPARHRAGDPLDPNEAGRSVATRGSQEFDDPIAVDVAAETLLGMDPGQDRPLGWLLARHRLIFLVHLD
jgi:hypothetical protein